MQLKLIFQEERNIAHASNRRTKVTSCSGPSLGVCCLQQRQTDLDNALCVLQHEAEQVWNTVESLEIVQPAQQHIAEEIKQLKQDCAVAEVKLDLTEGFQV